MSSIGYKQVAEKDIEEKWIRFDGVEPTLPCSE